MEMRLELVVVPVRDVERAKAFYEHGMGFALDVDARPGEGVRVVQLTPPGSACSIAIGEGIPQASPGSTMGLHLVVADIDAARADLVGRGVHVSPPFHFGAGGRTEGVDPERRDYATFATIEDPDGNVWLLQEVRAPAD